MKARPGDTLMDRCRVVSVSAGVAHGPLKPVLASIELVAGLGVSGDAHLGRTVQHRSCARAHPGWDNLRQVHLLGSDLLDELGERGFVVRPGEMGENVLTVGLDVLALPTGAVLRLGSTAEVQITGLRNPCSQLEGVQPGLTDAVLDRDPDGTLVRRAGVMSTVRQVGIVRPGDVLAVVEFRLERHALRPV